jgi:copper chaperone CopZ
MKKYIVIVLIITVSFLLYGRGNKEEQHEPLTNYNYEVSIKGMTCTLCSVAVEKQLIDLDWIIGVRGNHEQGIALLKVENEPNIAEMKKVIAPELVELGYTLIDIRKLANG